ncbi:MAG: peptidase M41 [Cryomorphaceae bacterium BACL7 MAG-120322-bin74]|jgi:ATP-dependent metalloprotease FtsH|nr:MAG: peptidase M41 [Cryomorphaceae bacterium BACL7 MAG-120322-bin74]KRO82770.1 MAG: peptidase M41 [Cryomorphaceae bacterium BACL7 MAG-121220-bin83]
MSDKTPTKKGQKPTFNPSWIYLAVFAGLLALQLFSSNYGATTQESNFNDLGDKLTAGHIEKIVVVNKKDVYTYIHPDSLATLAAYKDMATAGFNQTPNPGPHFHFEMPADIFDQNLERFYGQHEDWLQVNGPINVEYKDEPNYWTEVLSWVLPIGLIALFWFFMMRRMGGGGAGGPGGQIFNIGKSRAQVFDADSEVRTTFKNVAGMEGAKDEVLEVVDFLKNPKKYTNLGGKIPKGVLLSGPPGTGKTLLAKAVAGEAKVPFFSLSGSDFVEMFVGVGASRVRDLFKQAKEKSPAIIFIDEIDAIGRARGKNALSGGNDERENTLNQLLTEMDGFGTDEHVIVMGATNRADILDRALIRAGRFDRVIYVDLPEFNERKEIFEVHLKPLKLGGNVDIEFLARQTPGFSGADIANVCNEAALVAARKDKSCVEKQDFLDAVDRIVGGLEKKNKIITPEEKKVIAYHEAGHATVSWLLEHASPLVKVTIVPRGRSLGAAWYLPEERQLNSVEQMLDEMCATMGGRAAEEVIFNKITTGALSDLEKVTKQARAMVTIYGLNARLGNITYYDSSGQNEYQFDKPYSEKTAQVIDEEISALIEGQYERAKQLLRDNLDKLTALAEELLKHEVIFKENLENIFGKRPWLTSEEKVQAALLQNQPLEAGIPVETGADVSVQETASEEAENDPQGNA